MPGKHQRMQQIRHLDTKQTHNPTINISKVAYQLLVFPTDNYSNIKHAIPDKTETRSVRRKKRQKIGACLRLHSYGAHRAQRRGAHRRLELCALDMLVINLLSLMLQTCSSQVTCSSFFSVKLLGEFFKSKYLFYKQFIF